MVRFYRKLLDRHIVIEDAPVTEDELRGMFAERTAARTYEEWMRAFCERKYNSDFAREMSRSVRKYLDDFLQQ